MSDSVAYLTAVRDDDHLIYYNMAYYYNIGIKHYYIMLHCATDAVKAEIERFRSHYPVAVNTLIDDDYVYRKDKHFNMLSDMAANDGKRWHVATDADELLVLRSHKTVQDFLREYEEYDVLRFKWFNYAGEWYNNPFVDRVMRRVEPNINGKAVARWHDGLFWVTGQHFLYNSDKQHFVDEHIAYYAHFPYLDFKRFEKRKIDFAHTKYERFKDNAEAWASWRRQCNYDDIMTNKDFLAKWWSSIKNDENEHCYIFDPVPSELFK